MDKEKIQARLAELKQQLERVTADGNAIVGAIQDCEYWLAQIEQEESKPKEGKKA